MRRSYRPSPFLPPISTSPRLREGFGAGFDHPALVPELIMLGWAVFPRASVRGLRPHRHEGVWELCYLVDGATEWWVENEGGFKVGRGDWFVTRPGEWHGGVDGVMHPCELFWAQVALPLKGLEERDADAVGRGLQTLRARQFPAQNNVPTLFGDVIQEHRSGENALAPLSVRALLHRLLVTLLRDYSHFAADTMEAATPPALSPEIAHAQNWMRERLAEPFVMNEAARAVGLPPARFYERFLREAGLPPGEWRTRTRIDKAKAFLLLPGETVTGIAFALGFPSSQHFATVFKKYVGLTPSQFRQSVNRAKNPHF